MTATTTRDTVLADLDDRKRQIDAVFGGGICFEVDWATFDDSAARSVDSVSGYPLLRAIQLICREQPGKIEALRDALKTIRLVNVASGVRIDLLDGVLEVRCDFTRESGPGPEYAEIREVLEKHLPVLSDAFSRFLNSMPIDVEVWRDGTGYDLDALVEMTPGERVMVEKKLLEHLAGPGDWRDVEALAALGTPSALEAVAAAREHGNREVRKRTLAYAIEDAPIIAGEVDVLEYFVRVTADVRSVLTDWTYYKAPSPRLRGDPFMRKILFFIHKHLPYQAARYSASKSASVHALGFDKWHPS